MARPLWKGAISFGLIHVPVTLQTAARASNIDLDLLDKRDFSPVGYQRVNKNTGKPVDWKAIVKGYQYEKGEYVVLTEEDFRQANVEATRTIDIEGFVERDSIEPFYFDTPYYVLPERSAVKVYGLLREALVRSKKIAVATVVIRTRQHIAALMPMGDIFVLNTLRFAPEILPMPKPVAAAKGSGRAAQTTGKELQMALKLIDEMSEDWQPKQYKDTYRDDLMKRIEKKIEAGQTKTLTAPQEEDGKKRASSGKVVDLMSLLEKSLAERRGGSASEGEGTTKRRRRRSARRSTTRTSRRRA